MDRRAEVLRLLNRLLRTLEARGGATRQQVAGGVAHALDLAPSSDLAGWLAASAERDAAPDPRDAGRVALLARLGVRDAGLDLEWAEHLLSVCRYPDHALAVRQLSAPATDQPVHNVPARPEARLVGREAEIAQVLRLLAPDSPQAIVSIAGAGGIGKSRLALEVGWRLINEAAALSPAARFDAVVWSGPPPAAGERSSGTPERAGGLVCLHQTIAAVLQLGAAGGAAGKSVAGSIAQMLLAAGRVLLILDQLDEGRDSDIFAFLPMLPPRTKTLITLRFTEELPFPIRLRPVAL